MEKKGHGYLQLCEAILLSLSSSLQYLHYLQLQKIFYLYIFKERKEMEL